MHPRRTWGQRLVLLFNSLVIVGAVAAAAAIWVANDTLAETKRVPIHVGAPATTTTTTPASTGTVAPLETTSTLDLSGEVSAQNYLLVGSDSRACIDPSSPYAGAFLTEGNDIGDRSDTIMLLRVDPNEKQAAILSFPRDLWVRIGTTNRKGRINSAFEKDDPSRLVATIERNFELPVDHYIEVDFCAFKYLVDALGGVKVPFAFPTFDKYTGLDIVAPGCYTLNGDAALAYVRSRHYTYVEDGRQKEDGSSDRGRIRRQQDFIKRTLRKAIDRGATRPDVAKRLLDTALNYVRIDDKLTVNDMLRVANRLRSFDPESVRTYRLDGRGTTIGGASVIVPSLNNQETRDVLKLFRGEATIAEVPADATTAAAGSSTAPSSASTTAASTTTAAVATNDGTSATTSVAPSVIVVDNGVGIFPPDDPTCR
jgi:LCP family protein required for cell wall assembly